MAKESLSPGSERVRSQSEIREKVPKPEMYDLMNELTKEAVDRYNKAMITFMEEEGVILPPSSLELRSKHAEAKQDAIDHFRKRFKGRPVGVWKLEREIDSLFQIMAIEAARVRKASFGSDQSDGRASYGSGTTTPGELADHQGPSMDCNHLPSFINCAGTV